MGGIEILSERYKIIFGFIGVITLGIGLSLLLPLLTLFFYKTTNEEIYSFVIAAVIGVVVGIILRTNLKKTRDRSLSLQEGGIIVLISWIIAAILGGLPFVVSGQLTFTQAIFEAVSGFTTTGLSVVDVTKTSDMFLLWRSIMQLIGGAGLAVIMMAAIIGPLGDTLYNAEGRSDRLVPNAKKSVGLIMTLYLGYIVAGFLLYVIAGMPVFDSINHSIAAISTGGFSTKTDSIGFYNSPAIELITIILMILGTINFASHAILWKGRVKEFFRIGETKFMFVLMGVTIPLVFFFTTINLYSLLSKSIRVSFFEMISAISTTGFSTVGYSDWNLSGVYILIFVMLIGGGVGSTAGGIKLYRVYALLKSFIWNIKRIDSPKRSIKENFLVRPEGKVFISDSHLVDIMCYLTIYLVSFIIGVYILLNHDYTLSQSMFEIASCLSTVGLSLGVTSADASTTVLWTEIVCMFLGRLEFFVVFYAIVKLVKDYKFIVKSRK